MKRKPPASYLEQLRRLARDRGGRLLSRSYFGDTTKLRFRCAEGHVFSQTPGGVKQLKWCRLCGWARAAAKRRATTEARLRRIVASRGGAILSSRYVNSDTPLRFRCAKGHEWATSPNSIFQGNWCRRCSNEARYAPLRERVLRRLQKIALKHGGEVVGSKRARWSSRLVLRCGKGHRWRSLPATIFRGAWCRVCDRESYLERLRKIARDRGGELLSRAYVNEDTVLRFRCAAGHRFEQRPGDAARDHWCPRCAAMRRAEKRKAPARARLHRLVERRGGIVLSPAYINSQTRQRYRCAQGHEWSTVPNLILRGSWCPVCAIRDRTRHHVRRKRRVSGRLLRIVKRRSGEILPPGFVSFKNRIRLRCARGHTWEAPVAGIAEEVWCPRCREERLMAVLQARAERWGGACLSPSCRSGKERLVYRCAQGHRFQRTGDEIKRGVWCLKCRGLEPGDIQRMRQTARERGGECLSEEYVDAATKLRWRCRKGHEWNAEPGDIITGCWCPECARWSSHSRARLSIEAMRETAAERGGECRSAIYSGSKGRLLWRCARGHEWVALPSLVRQGSWCPVCAHSARGTVDGMRALAIERGGRCLTRTWNDHRRKLLFECARGHRFHAYASAVKTGVWCPNCRA